MNRRSFLGALMGVLAAPKLIERIKTWDHLLVRFVKVQGTIEISGETLRKCQAEEGAFVRWAERAIADANERSMAEVLRMYSA